MVIVVIVDFRFITLVICVHKEHTIWAQQKEIQFENNYKDTFTLVRFQITAVIHQAEFLCCMPSK